MCGDDSRQWEVAETGMMYMKASGPSQSDQDTLSQAV